MSEVRPTYDNEIDLFDLVETLWHGKWVIVATTIFAALVGIGYSAWKPNSFNVTAPLYDGKSTAFVEYAYLNDVLKKNKLDHSINSKRMFTLFVSEFNDYEEMIAALSKDEFVNQVIKDLNEKDKRKALISLAKSFEIRPPKKGQTNWSLAFQWHDNQDGIDLFDEALLLTLTNVKTSTIENIEGLASFLDQKNLRDLETSKIELALIEKKQRERDRKQIQYLKEQSSIAKELGIETNRLDANALSQSSQNAISLNVGSNEFPFYLRGFKAIDIEISLIIKRSKAETLLMSGDYVEVSEKILALENDLSSKHVRDALNIIENDNPDDWVEYNLELADSQPQKKPVLYVAMSIILGGLFGSIYVLIAKVMRQRKELQADA